MKSRIVCLAPGQVSPGMTLATAINGHDGHTLLAAGTIVDAEMLERLIRRGVEAINILVNDPRSEETIARELQAAEDRINAIFRGNGTAARSELKKTMVEFRQESLK